MFSPSFLASINAWSNAVSIGCVQLIIKCGFVAWGARSFGDEGAWFGDAPLFVVGDGGDGDSDGGGGAKEEGLVGA